MHATPKPSFSCHPCLGPGAQHPCSTFAPKAPSVAAVNTLALTRGTHRLAVLLLLDSHAPGPRRVTAAPAQVSDLQLIFPHEHPDSSSLPPLAPSHLQHDWPWQKWRLSCRRKDPPTGRSSSTCPHETPVCRPRWAKPGCSCRSVPGTAHMPLVVSQRQLSRATDCAEADCVVGDPRPNPGCHHRE